MEMNWRTSIKCLSLLTAIHSNFGNVFVKSAETKLLLSISIAILKNKYSLALEKLHTSIVIAKIYIYPSQLQ